MFLKTYKYLQYTVCMHVLETAKCVKEFCLGSLPSNIKEDQPYNTRQIQNVKIHGQQIYKKETFS